MTPAEINQDPVQGEFFSATADLPGRLVREAIQNSLDARRGDAPVRVRFAFSGDGGGLPQEKTGRYLDGLRQHVEAVVDAGGMSATGMDAAGDDEADALSCFRKPMTYLVVEDFGTTGLTGEITANSEHEPGNHFWGFFRSTGISPKGENDAGSWGLGKWVFPDASIINAYLGMTQRHGEDNWLLMGMALLETHHIGKDKYDKYHHYGFFAAASGEPDARWFPHPVEARSDDNFILEALQDFRLSRLDDTGPSPGLSVIVPYPKPELEPRAIARAVITQWFLPIVRGDLVVEIDHPDEDRRTIDAGTITAEVANIAESDRDDESSQSLRGAIELARWAIARDGSEYSDLPVQKLAAEVKQEDLDDLRRRYEDGERLAFCLTGDVRRKGEASVPSEFRVCLERADDIENGHDYFVRGHLRIAKMDHIKRRKARALVLVDDNSALGHMLRDAEGPAHVSWDANAQRLKANWIGGQKRVQDVRHAAAGLLKWLVERPGERQMDALADLFPGDPSQIGRGRSTTGGGGGPTVDLPPRSPQNVLQIDSPAGALVVKPPAARDEARTLTGTAWEMRFAYDTVRGDPFGVFDRGVDQGAPDFSLRDGGLHTVQEGCELEIVAHNALRFEVLDEEFRLTVSGFDARDMKVELRGIRETAAETGEPEVEAA